MSQIGRLKEGEEGGREDIEKEGGGEQWCRGGRGRGVGRKKKKVGEYGFLVFFLILLL